MQKPVKSAAPAAKAAKTDTPPQPWKPADATDRIRRMARGDFDLLSGVHWVEQLDDRKLIVSDLLYLLKNGFVYDAPMKSTRPHLYKYQMEYTTPNSHGRSLRVVLIPCASANTIKIVTIMWRDEAVISGSRR